MRLLKVYHLLSTFLLNRRCFSMLILVFFVKPEESCGIQTYAGSLKMIDDWMIIYNSGIAKNNV